MSSKRPSDLIPELEFPATSDEIEMLRRLGPPHIERFEDYLTFLRSFGDTPTEVLRAKPGPQGAEFEL